MAKDNGSIERRVVRELIRKENKRGWTEITVVDWVIGGDRPGTYRQLEKREFYRQEDGSQKTGKAKGFTKDEFALLLGRAREIMTLLGGGAADAPTPAQNVNAAATAQAAEPQGRPDPF